jgi:endonuclease/exonuclease/phosphatase family metal-dependent hydrolase
VQHIAGPIALLGDFNLISEAADKRNTNFNRGQMMAFRRFMNALELKDLYLHGRRFTWSNEQMRTTLCRLDRVLYNNWWHDIFPRAMLQAVSSAASDHSPLVLSLDADFKTNRRFRFETF